jgi:L-cystine uptake protein TcyP (sodium:dicarboxylate symporter family)
MFEAILEIIITPIATPIEKWITRITNKKTERFNKVLRNTIKVILFILGIGALIGTICLFSFIFRGYWI